MGLKSLVKKYHAYEDKEAERRVARKKKLAPYKKLKDKRITVKKIKKEFKPEKFTKAIGNPYGVSYKKIKKLKKVKKIIKKKRKGRKITVYVR